MCVAMAHVFPGVQVHPGCYHETQPTEEWQCRPCAAGIDPRPLVCQLCPHSGHAYTAVVHSSDWVCFACWERFFSPVTANTTRRLLGGPMPVDRYTSRAPRIWGLRFLSAKDATLVWWMALIKWSRCVISWYLLSYAFG